MNFDIKEIISATMVLFAVVDIIGSVPIIINLRKKAGRIQSEKTAIVAGGLLVVFLFLGKQFNRKMRHRPPVLLGKPAGQHGQIILWHSILERDFKTRPIT